MLCLDVCCGMRVWGRWLLLVLVIVQNVELCVSVSFCGDKGCAEIYSLALHVVVQMSGSGGGGGCVVCKDGGMRGGRWLCGL